MPKEALDAPISDEEDNTAAEQPEGGEDKVERLGLVLIAIGYELHYVIRIANAKGET